MKSFNKIASNLHKMRRRREKTNEKKKNKPQKLLSRLPLYNNCSCAVRKLQSRRQTMENFGSGNNKICETGDQSAPAALPAPNKTKQNERKIKKNTILLYILSLFLFHAQWNVLMMPATVGCGCGSGSGRGSDWGGFNIKPNNSGS